MSDADLDPEAYLPLVRRIAARAWARIPSSAISNIEYDDLVSAGTLGLMQALPRYPDNGIASVETWVSRRIWGEIRQFLRNADVLKQCQRLKVKRGAAREPEHVHLDRHRPPPPPLSSCDDPEGALLLRRAVERALAELPPELREIATRHLMAGENIGRMVVDGEPVMVAVQRRAEVVAKLRVLLQDEWES